MRVLLIFLYLMFVSSQAAAETQVNVVGLFNGKAILSINGGKPKTYSVGQVTPDGIKVISADSSKVILEVDGKRRELGMGQGIAIAGGGSSAQTATLYANNAGHFLGEGYINGSSMKFLVDTGASSIALSGKEARRLGLSYLNGDIGAASTAAGVVKAYRISLNTVKIGGIVMHQVEAMVLEGDSPPVVLLGMSVLNRVQMERDGMVMTLTKKY
ncbi:MAG: TIGR02281 family clan AA aspartic protease [Methylophilaceae bacterium]|uniref:retropepsin-like aspartic protease family protein n=1 Tax=Methylobacillus sp. MM3 TaxID=1848039 RepID=UPI0007DE58FF|nr:TIGR02281 family clan AA aspartic protease [Methylobacillus sp. MM3]OAJ71361.1 aspartyl protease [Methylobacillus sp. MM3]